MSEDSLLEKRMTPWHKRPEKSHRSLLVENKQLKERVLTDELTGFANEKGMEIGLDQKLHEINRSVDSNAGLALIKMDIAHFKIFDDLFSWKEGDNRLLRLKEMLTQKNTDHALGLRVGDVIGRKGGDDFIIMASISGQGEMEKIIERLVKIGENLHKETGELYKNEFNHKLEINKAFVLKTLRLTDNFEGDLKWENLGIMSLTIGGVFLDKEKVDDFLKKGNIEDIWNIEIEPRLDVISQKSKDEKTEKTTATIFEDQTFRIDKIIKPD